jgi:hypothetical protein
MSKIEVHLQREEVVRVLGKTAKPLSPLSRIRHEEEFLSKERKKESNAEGQDQHPGQRWTPLNASLSIVFMEARKDPNFSPPQRMRTLPTKRSNQKYCEYHRDHGHWTEECIALRKEVEILIQCGKLEKFKAKRSSAEGYLWNDLPKEEEPKRKLTTLEILKGSALTNENHLERLSSLGNRGLPKQLLEEG